ncbi:unnamed protein product [Dimorphilus gyrociliatus]|uniref:BUD13 homolog n=1 Tax=Dimorphilus gyrociliatus TaxID=2664684 RepID=A0A7I8VQ02_9ANNE|nr:unnamed protein product [Dimorphilus gyrociliatus]
MAESVSKEEYLKRYLAGGPDDKKKKRRKKVGVKEATMKIVDNTLSVDKFVGREDEHEDEVVALEETPQIVAVIDDRPEDVKLEERIKSGKWRRLTDQATNSFVKVEPNQSPKIKEEPRSPSNQLSSDNTSSNIRIKEEPVTPPRHTETSLGQRRRSQSNDSSKRVKRTRRDSDSDQSLPRRRYDSDSDNSPRAARKRYDSDSDNDQSPPRRGNNKDLSPVRSGRKRHDSDQSPPRRGRNEDSSHTRSERNRYDSDSDQSPARRRKRNNEDDISPPRSKRKRDVNEDSDNSPPRRRNQQTKMTKTLAGTKAGLSSAKDVRMELDDLRKRETAAFNVADENILGKNAKTVFRDKEGKKRNLAKENEKDDAKKKLEEELKKKYSLWNKGLVQQQRHDNNIKDAIHESKKEFARHKNDADLEEYLKSQDREGDPMLKFIKKKKEKTRIKNKEPVRPKYNGPPPPINRFGIQPGYRWDGLDRSNGFENELFNKANAREANEEIGYRWATEDM